jgi:hypothetical protein
MWIFNEIPKVTSLKWPIHSDALNKIVSINFLKHIGIYIYIYNVLGTAVAQWFRCCATNRKVAGSIPDGVIEFFYGHNSSDRTMALGSTQPLT